MSVCDSLQGSDALFEPLLQPDRTERAGNLFGQLGDLASELADLGVCAGDVGDSSSARVIRPAQYPSIARLSSRCGPIRGDPRMVAVNG